MEKLYFCKIIALLLMQIVELHATGKLHSVFLNIQGTQKNTP